MATNVFENQFIDKTSQAYRELVGQPSGLYFPPQYKTAQRPEYQKGGMYFDLTTSKMVFGGVAGYEVITSV